LGNRPRAFVPSLGSRPNVEGCGGETVLVCMPAADALLEGSSPYAFDHVYEANACQPFARRLSVVMTRPSYVNEYPSGLVNRKRRAAGKVMAVSSRYTVAVRPSASFWVPSTYFPAASVQLMKLLPPLWTYDVDTVS